MTLKNGHVIPKFWVLENFVTYILKRIMLFAHLRRLYNQVHYNCVTCSGGHYLVQGTGCLACGQNTFAPSGVKTSCTSCPTGKTVLSGQGSSLSDCSWGKYFL